MPDTSNKTKAQVKKSQYKGQKKNSAVNKAPVFKKATTKNPKELAKKGSKDRELYVEWASIPAMLRMMKPEDLTRMGYDTSDPVFMKMVGIKRKGEFCAEFGIGSNQPAKWEKEPTFYEEVNARSSQSHVMKFRKDIDFGFTQKVIRHGDAARMKLWKQVYEGWSERTEAVNVNLNMTPADIVREIEARNKKLRPDVKEL
jgi:hypothetical protein